MPPQVTLAPQLRIYTFTSLMSTHRHPEHKLQIHEKSEWFLMTAAPPSSGVLQKRLPPCHTAKKKRLEVPTILPEPPRPKDAKSVEKPGRRAILAALEFFHISCFLRIPRYRFWPLIEFPIYPTELPRKNGRDSIMKFCVPTDSAAEWG